MKKLVVVFVVSAGLLLSSCGSASVLLIDHNCVYEYDKAHNVYRLIWNFSAEKHPSGKDTLTVSETIHH